ncbi:MAG: LuxR family transcriptional regulator [Actinomycetota bacterium]|nr:LuxR family transcriptional regulator [Actinomycetota bacterium]
MLVGRETEVRHIESLLGDVRAGRARSLLLAGEAGIGKTALLEAAVERASDFIVLRARGIETEGEIGGAVLSELLGPPGRLHPELREGWTAMSDRLRHALEAAWSLQPLAGDRYCVVAAWAALLVAAGESLPVLVVVDDAQWGDAASLDAVLFVARRFHDVRVGTLLAIREPPEASTVFDGLDRLCLGRLDRTAAQLLATREGGSADVVEAAAGHPLALVELARRGSVSASHEVAATLFGARVAGLSPEGRRTLLAAALAGPVDTEVVAVAGTSPGVDELIRVGLMTVGPGLLELVHPLVRSLIRDLTGLSEQRAVHASVAAALPPGPQRTKHLALAADAPDADLAAEVESLGLGVPPSVWALSRAASLTPAGEHRDRRFLAAARAAFDGRDIAACRGLLDRVSAADGDLGLGVAEMRARLATLDGARLDGARGLAQVARRTARSDPERAVRLLVTASIELVYHPTKVEARAAIDEAAALVGNDPVLRLLVDFANAELLGASGEFVAAQHAFRDLAELGDPESAVHADHTARLMLLEAMYCGGLRQRGRQVAVAAAHDARASGALGDLHLALSCRFSIEREDARFDAAEDAAAEELELASGLGRTTERREALGQLAWCDSVKGRGADCRRHLDERRELSERMGIGASAHPALGLLHLGEGDVAGAVAALAAAEENAAQEGMTPAGGLRPCTLDLVEALIYSGELGRAAAVLARFEDDARRLDRPLALALASRGRGLLASGDAADGLFEESLRWELLEPSPFERARTELCWGQHLRRRRAKRAATEQLEAARSSFEHFGADLWVGRAERELAANGERLRPRRDGTGVELTSQERRVVDLVSRGLSNRDVATDMFLSVNTVETHLRHVFRKLGVSSRTQLAALNHGNP